MARRVDQALTGSFFSTATAICASGSIDSYLSLRSISILIRLSSCSAVPLSELLSCLNSPDSVFIVLPTLIFREQSAYRDYNIALIA